MMHSHLVPQWKYAWQLAGCGPRGGCRPIEPSFPLHHYFSRGGDPGDFGSGAFGVRRPLRFLAWKLQLDEAQVREMARILDQLKTERAQAEVDRRRTMTAFADAVGGETFDDARAAEGATLRTQGAERIRDAVVRALKGMHEVLDPAQREQLAYLIRTGSLLL